MYWTNFIEMIEGKVSLCHYGIKFDAVSTLTAQNGRLNLMNQVGEIEDFTLDFKAILFFTTVMHHTCHRQDYLNIQLLLSRIIALTSGLIHVPIQSTCLQ